MFSNMNLILSSNIQSQALNVLELQVILCLDVKQDLIRIKSRYIDFKEYFCFQIDQVLLKLALQKTF